MYQISAADALKFVTPNYIPVDTVRRANGYLANTYDNSPGQNQYDLEVAAGSSGNGSIETVHLTTRGSGYLGEAGTLTAVTNSSTFTIAGAAFVNDDCIVNNDIYMTSGNASGQGGTIIDFVTSSKVVTINTSGGGTAVGFANTVNATGAVNAVGIIAGGNNYSNATISIIANTSQSGTLSNPSPAAALTPIVGPAGGHGSDAVKELGGYYVITNARLEYSESNNFTTNNDFRKVGLIAQPKFANGDFATSSVIDQATTIVLSSWNGTQYSADELITGATSGCTGRVVDFTGNNTLRMTDIIPSGNSTTAGYNGVYGYFTNTEIIAANTTGAGGSGASATANGSGAVSGGDLTRFSGDVLYVENRSPVTRASDQIEDIKLVVEF